QVQGILEGGAAPGQPDLRKAPARLAPAHQHQASAPRRQPDGVLPGAGAQPPGLRALPCGGCRGGAHLSVPTSSPETHCFWKMKKTTAVGMAATRAPAAITFHELPKPPIMFSSCAVMGNLSSVRSTVMAQIRSLKIQVVDSAPSAA